MNTLFQLSCSFMRKGLVRLVAPLLFSTLILLGVVGPHNAYAWNSVNLTVHSDAAGQTQYVALGYNNGTKTGCMQVPAFSWLDMHVQISLGQSAYLNYYHAGTCDGSQQYMSVTLPIPSQTDSDCWFNPAAQSGTPNFSGCVNPSQKLEIHYGPGTNVA